MTWLRIDFNKHNNQSLLFGGFVNIPSLKVIISDLLTVSYTAHIKNTVPMQIL